MVLFKPIGLGLSICGYKVDEKTERNSFHELSNYILVIKRDAVMSICQTTSSR